MGLLQSRFGAAKLKDRYVIQRVKLDEGKYWKVWRGLDREVCDSPVAVKQVDKGQGARYGVRYLDIAREVETMRACSHENVARLLNTFEDAESIYLVMEYWEDGNLGDKVKEVGMGVEEATVAEWALQMCSAIVALHGKRICHRDIRLDNFLVHIGSTMTLKLSGFIFAVSVPSGRLLRERCGTPAFMAPELLTWIPSYSFPADMWAMGVALFAMMFAGRHPFVDENGHFVESLRLKGELDFRERICGLGGLGGLLSPLRFSEEARRLCKGMVNPDQFERVTADGALASSWLLRAQERREEQPPHERIEQLEAVVNAQQEANEAQWAQLVSDVSSGRAARGRADAEGEAEGDAARLAAGEAVEVFSNSHGCWCPGRVHSVDETGAATLVFRPPGTEEVFWKFLPPGHHNLRRAQGGLAPPLALPSLPSGPSGPSGPSTPSRPSRPGGPSTPSGPSGSPPTPTFWSPVGPGGLSPLTFWSPVGQGGPPPAPALPGGGSPRSPGGSAVSRAVPKPALEFKGRLVEDGPPEAIASFPGVEEELWKGITQSMPNLSCTCVFFPDHLPCGTPHKLFGKHMSPCKCVELYGSVTDWGCMWFSRWATNTQEAVGYNKRLVIVYKRGLKGDHDAGLGTSQKGEVAYIRRKLPHADVVEMDVKELVAFLEGLGGSGAAAAAPPRGGPRAAAQRPRGSQSGSRGADDLGLLDTETRDVPCRACRVQ